MPRVGPCGGAGSEAKGGGRYHHPVPVQEPNRLPLQPHLADGARQDRTPEENHTAAGGQPQTSDPNRRYPADSRSMTTTAGSLPNPLTDDGHRLQLAVAGYLAPVTVRVRMSVPEAASAIRSGLSLMPR